MNGKGRGPVRTYIEKVKINGKEHIIKDTFPNHYSQELCDRLFKLFVKNYIQQYEQKDSTGY